MWLGMLLLLALAVFIVWDSRRLRDKAPEPLARERLERGFLPRGVVPWHFHFGLSGVLAVLAFIEWQSPSLPPYTGRWSWLHRAAFEVFGERGLFAWWLLLGVLMLVVGLVQRHREKGRGRDGAARR